MDLIPTELYTIENGTKSLTEYVIDSINKHLYEVKDGDAVLYEGESYQNAKSLYEQKDQEETPPALSTAIETPKVVYEDQKKTQSEISEPTKTSEVTYQGQEINFKDSGLINLTRAWKAAGAPEDKHPKQWLGLPSTVELINTIKEDFRTKESDLLVTERGRYGGTFAPWRIFLAYAKYLGPEFHMWANQVKKERFAQN